MHIYKKYFKGKRKKFKKNCQLNSYAITFGQRTFFSIKKLVFPEKCEFYLFYYNAIHRSHII